MKRDVDTVRRALAQVWETQGRRFATFEIDGRSGPDADRWIQYLDGELNVRWPIDEAPAVALPRLGVALPRGAFAAWHVARANAVIEVGDAGIDDVARLVCDLFARVLCDGADFRVAARVEDHDAPGAGAA